MLRGGDELSCSTEDSFLNAKKSKTRGQVKKFTLGPVPLAGGFKNYQMEVYTKVIVESKRSCLQILKWIQEIENVKLKKLENPKV